MITSTLAFRKTAVFAILGFLVAAFGCAPDADPFKVGDRATIEAGSSDATAGIPAATTTASGPDLTNNAIASLPAEGNGTIRFADWNNNEVSLLNNLLGYIIVWGFDYKVELIDVNEAGYQSAMSGGSADIVTEVPKAEAGEWLAQQAAAGALIDAGSAFGPASEIRMAITPTITREAPEVAEFVRRVSLDKAAIESLAAQITGGRTGVKPTVAALMYLKANDAVWSTWMPARVADEVRAAMAAGKTSLLNRSCLPSGGSGNTGEPACARVN